MENIALVSGTLDYIHHKKKTRTGISEDGEGTQLREQ